MNIQDLISHLEGVRRNRNGYVAKCPAHEDDRQSLAITETSDRVLLNCFAGCTTERILKTLGMEWQELFRKEKRQITHTHSRNGVTYFAAPGPKEKAVYRYTDENGQLLYENVRFEPKDFRQRTFDEKGKPVWSLQGIGRVPYRLQQLVNNVRFGSDVFFCEGEKDADTLAELGFITTSFKNWKPEFNRYITHVNAIIVRDHDLPGGVQAEEAAQIISQAADSVKILDPWPDVELPEKHGRDVTDYVMFCVKDEGLSREEIAKRLSNMADGAPRWLSTSAGKMPNAFLTKKANTWVDESMLRPSPKMLFGEFWFEGELCILFADTNVGKSILAVQMGDAISRGQSVGGIKVECGPKRVVYFDFELTDKQFESRLAERVEGSDRYVNHYRFSDNFLRSELDPETDDLHGFETFEEFLNFSLDRTIVENQAEVLIVDNLTYLRDETENARNALPLMKYLKELKKKHGISILALAHTPKRDSYKPLGRNDLQGSKMLINFCDSSFAIGESHKDQGVRYLKQIKCRNTAPIYNGENVLLAGIVKVSNFLQLDFLGTASEREHLKTNSEKEKDQIVARAKEMAAQGMSTREIATHLGVSHVTVSKYIAS